MSHDFLRRAVRGAVVALCLLGGMSTAAFAQIRFGVGIALPGVRIGVNIPAYPDLVPVPGYPVYYAPQLDVNLFFYDGLYWLFADDEWYSSSWYNGPWYLVPPEQVPDFILRIPVGFYRHPPLFFEPQCSAALGGALGPALAAQPAGMGPLEPPRRTASRAPAALSTRLPWRALSQSQRAANVAGSVLPLPAAHSARPSTPRAAALPATTAAALPRTAAPQPAAAAAALPRTAAPQPAAAAAQGTAAAAARASPGWATARLIAAR